MSCSALTCGAFLCVLWGGPAGRQLDLPLLAFKGVRSCHELRGPYCWSEVRPRS